MRSASELRTPPILASARAAESRTAGALDHKSGVSQGTTCSIRSAPAIRALLALTMDSRDPSPSVTASATPERLMAETICRNGALSGSSGAISSTSKAELLTSPSWRSIFNLSLLPAATAFRWRRTSARRMASRVGSRGRTLTAPVSNRVPPSPTPQRRSAACDRGCSHVSVRGCPQACAPRA